MAARYAARTFFGVLNNDYSSGTVNAVRTANQLGPQGFGGLVGLQQPQSTTPRHQGSTSVDSNAYGTVTENVHGVAQGVIGTLIGSGYGTGAAGGSYLPGRRQPERRFPVSKEQSLSQNPKIKVYF